jgi:hypothetical protein
MSFGSGNKNAFLCPLGDMNEQIGIGLFVRRKAPVAFNVGHRAAYHQILLLNLDDEVFEPFVINGLIFFVDLKGRRIKRIERVHPDAALKARPGQLAQPSLHFVLQNDFVPAHRNIKKTIDLLAC